MKVKELPLVVHGSTGSIGKDTLEVVKLLREAGSRRQFTVEGLACNSSIDLFEQQIREFRPRYAAVADERSADLLRERMGRLKHTAILSGEDAVRICGMINGGMVVIATDGFDGLAPTLAAIESGNRVAVANKEAFLTAGRLIFDAARRYKVEVLPIDSEPSAMWQCLETLVYVGRNSKRRSLIWDLHNAPSGKAKINIHSVLLTCSGGPFRDAELFPMSKLHRVTPEEALKHPTWDKMGWLITIRSATLANKAMEIIEAASIFNLSVDQVTVVIHPQSLVHSGIQMRGGRNYILQAGANRMTHPILYALTFPYNTEEIELERLDLLNGATLTFEAPDTERFPYLNLGYMAGKLGGTAPAVLNGADEVAVQLFSDRRMRFTAMAEIVSEALRTIPVVQNPTLNDIREADAEARHFAEAFFLEHEGDLRASRRRR